MYYGEHLWPGHETYSLRVCQDAQNCAFWHRLITIHCVHDFKKKFFFKYDDVLYFKDIMHRKHKHMLFPEVDVNQTLSTYV